MPPVSRIEDYQSRRCVRLRKTLRGCLANIIGASNHACNVLRPLAEQLDLEKYYDIYDISDLDMQEAALGYSDAEFEDPDSLRVLKLLAARFHTIRKIFLCCLLALDADGGKPDFPRWSAALDEIRGLSLVTGHADEQLRRILGEEEGELKYATTQ